MTTLLRGVPLAEARVLCVVVHGRGQTPEAMEDAILSHMTTPEVAYVLPRADTGSWYAARAADPLTDQARLDLGQSLDRLAGAISSARALAPSIPLVLAGFSQGACLAVEHAFATGPWPGALVALTGCRVGVAGDERPSLALPGLPVYLSGGDVDPWIPVAAFAEAVAALGSAQARLRADVFPGRGHEVAREELLVLDALLGDLAAGRTVSWAVPAGEAAA